MEERAAVPIGHSVIRRQFSFSVEANASTGILTTWYHLWVPAEDLLISASNLSTALLSLRYGLCEVAAARIALAPGEGSVLLQPYHEHESERLFANQRGIVVLGITTAEHADVPRVDALSIRISVERRRGHTLLMLKEDLMQGHNPFLSEYRSR